MPQNDQNIMIENADLPPFMRNFRGAEGKYNSTGERNFSVMLDNHPEIADRLANDGWNIKLLKARSDEEVDRPFLPVRVKYGQRPPTVVIITSRGRSTIGEDLVDMLDYADIEKVDLVINPYHYNFNGNSGIKAYLKSIYVTLQEDALARKYAAIPEINAIEGPTRRLEIEAGPDSDVIDLDPEDYSETVG